MTEIAQERDELGGKVETLVNKISEAKNKSIQVYENIKNTHHVMQQNISDESRKFKANAPNVELKFNKTIKWTKQVSYRAREVRM